MNIEKSIAPAHAKEQSLATGTLEHVNLTVSDPDRTAQMLVDLFGWHVRWTGSSIYDGYSVHVGNDADYIALYRGPEQAEDGSSYALQGGLNHIGIVVADLDAVEARVVAAGYKPNGHADYEPGRRFYFDDHDGVEFEVISYN